MESTKLYQIGRDVRISCPDCGGRGLLKKHQIIQLDGVTTDCGRCGSLLIIKKDVAYNFHQWLHSREPRWPANGANTYSVEL